MLAKKPDDRFQTPRDVAKALQPLAQKCNLPKLAAQAIAAVPVEAPSDLSGQETTPQASAGPVTATKIADAWPTAPAPELPLAAEKIRITPLPAPAQRRQRLPTGTWIAVATTFIAILCGVILIKVKDKDGNVVGTIEVPKGGSFEVSDGPVERLASGQRPSPDTATDPKSEISNLQSEIPEPPPLDEWLKGRTILTVAKDGSGRFNTIQAALDALKDGQVVEVLDKGPYVENLRLASRSDVGLVSQAGTVVQIEEWVEDTHSKNSRLGINFGGCDKLRLSGLTFHCEPSQHESYRALQLYDVPSACIENCRFVSSPSAPARHAALVLFPAAVRDSSQMTIRDCVFDEVCVSFHPPAFVSNIQIRHCLMRNTGGTHPLTINVSGDQAAATVARVTHNVIVSPKTTPVSLRCKNPGDNGTNAIMVDHNTIVSNVADGTWNRSLLVLYGLPAKNLRWTNNLLLGEPRFGMNDPGVDRELALKHWHVRSNAFASDYRDIDPFLNSEFNHAIDLPQISEDFSDASGFRIPATGPLATRSDDPTRPWIGALAPGPAPKEGDWFTELLRSVPDSIRQKSSAKSQAAGVSG